jgi:hypothetical protein
VFFKKACKGTIFKQKNLQVLEEPKKRAFFSDTTGKVVIFVGSVSYSNHFSARSGTIYVE